MEGDGEKCGGRRCRNPWEGPRPHTALIPTHCELDLVQQHGIGVSEIASAKTASAIDVRIDNVGSILKFRIGFPFGENSAGFYKSVWLPGSILNFSIAFVSSIGGLIAATLFADTVSNSQIKCKKMSAHIADILAHVSRWLPKRQQRQLPRRVG